MGGSPETQLSDAPTEAWGQVALTSPPGRL